MEVVDDPLLKLLATRRSILRPIFCQFVRPRQCSADSERVAILECSVASDSRALAKCAAEFYIGRQKLFVLWITQQSQPSVTPRFELLSAEYQGGGPLLMTARHLQSAL